MNQRLVAEFTALVAAQAHLVIESGESPSDALLWVYWQHGKTLLHRWRVRLQDTTAAVSDTKHGGVLDVAANVLTSEMLTRVWGAVLTASDQHHHGRRCEPIARSLLTTHQQCRACVLRVLLHSTTLSVEHSAELDRLRRRVERWTDVLVGPLLVKYGDTLSDFAFDARRAADFGQDQFQARFQSANSPAWSFLLAGLSAAFPNERNVAPHVSDPMLPILRAILGSFPADTFTSQGPLTSLLASRVRRSSQRPEGPLVLPNSSKRSLRHDIRQHVHRAPLLSPRRPPN